MKTMKSQPAYQWYLQHRRDNFAASQRLEGVTHAVACKTPASMLPDKAELIRKYRVTRSEG